MPARASMMIMPLRFGCRASKVLARRFGARVLSFGFGGRAARVTPISSAALELEVMGVAGGAPSLRLSLTSACAGAQRARFDFLPDVLASCDVGVQARMFWLFERCSG